jgi:limonene-1,2-epoxide hydrolase
MTSPSTPAGSPFTPTQPQAVVEAFLDALAAADLERAADLVAEEVTYVNVGLPTIRGRARMIKLFRLMERPAVSFEVYLHAISASGRTVLTERTDVLSWGRYRAQFWVAGRFDVEDGQITLWRDAFDYLDILRATVRGLAGVLLPALRPTPPAGAAAPGRH